MTFASGRLGSSSPRVYSSSSKFQSTRHTFILLVLAAAAYQQKALAFSALTPQYSRNNRNFPFQSISTILHASPASTGTSAIDAPTSTAGPPAITLDGLTCSHDGGTKYQLQDVSYNLPRGAKVGLVGRNGCGKSTLLSILAESCGALSDTSSVADVGVVYTGKVEKAKDVTVALVEQEPPMSSDVTVAEALLGVTAASRSAADEKDGAKKDGPPTDVYEAILKYRSAIPYADTDPERFATCTSYMDEMDGWKTLARIDDVSTRLRVKALEDQPLSSLSGGERKRVALAAAFAREPDVLLLDEPTNHLDLQAIRWLSDIVRTSRMSVLVVTHDRAFLDDVCESVIELDDGKLFSYASTTSDGRGGYAAFLEGKEARLANEDAAIRAASAKYRTELDWMRRQPQARESKSKSRIDAFYKLEKSTKPRAVEANLELNTSDGQRRIGKNVLSLKNSNLQFGDKVILDSFTYNFNRGDKIGIVGSNGVGKSSFVRVMTGAQPLDNGEVSTGETVVFGVYEQMGIYIEDEEQRVMDYVKEKVESSSGQSLAEAPQEAMKLLKQFQFSRQRWNERIALLSGGERRRLQLLTILTKQPNFLILDEPTNDIDLDTLAALEDYLAQYNGVLVVVSHDRFFVDKVCDHLFVFEGNGRIKDFTGTLTEYASAIEQMEGQNDASGGSSGGSGGHSGQGKKQESYKEDKAARVEHRNAVKAIKKKMNYLEPQIDKLKAKAADVQTEIDGTDSAEGWTVLAELTEKMNKLNEEADEKEMEWLELAEELEALEADG